MLTNDDCLMPSNNNLWCNKMHRKVVYSLLYQQEYLIFCLISLPVVAFTIWYRALNTATSI